MAKSSKLIKIRNLDTTIEWIKDKDRWLNLQGDQRIFPDILVKYPKILRDRKVSFD